MRHRIAYILIASAVLTGIASLPGPINDSLRQTATGIFSIVTSYISSPIVSLQYNISAGAKKGFAITTKAGSINNVNSLNVSWYYTWGIHSLPGTTSAEFVPMIWGGSDSRIQSDINAIKMQSLPIADLLTFNEPDLATQANMTTTTALAFWPQFIDLTSNLGSPVMARNPATPGYWFDKFFTQLTAQGLRLDFIAIHSYTSSADSFLAKIDSVWMAYHKPIWITEFCPASTSSAATLQFMKQVLPELERRSYVKRYAWFGPPGYAGVPAQNCLLFDASGALNSLGEYYANYAP